MTNTAYIGRDEIHGYCIIRVELDKAGQPFDWTFIHANEELARIEGKPLDEIIGHRFYELFPEGDRKWLNYYYEAAYLGKSVSFDEISDEIGLYLHVEAYPTDRKGYCSCVICDIRNSIFSKLEHQEEQEALLESYEEERTRDFRIRKLAEAMGFVYPLVISMDYLNDSYTIVEYENFVNRTAAEFGRIDELIRVGASTIPDAKIAEEFWTLFNREAAINAFRQGKKEIILRHPQNGDDGKMHYMDTHLICMECSENKVTAISMSRCIDEEAERDLSMQQAAEQAGVISALSIIYKTIMEADLLTHGFKIIRTDSPMKKVVGGVDDGNFDDVMEDVLKFYMHPDDIDRMREFIDLSTLSERFGSETTLVTEYKAPYDKWFESRFIAKKRDEEGRVISAIYAARDITAEKKKELNYRAQLEAAVKEAERANKTKTEFLLRMSHDIRTPLNGIRGMLDMADHYGNDLEKVRECRRKVRESSNILLELINEVLDMSKLESGEVELEHVPFDLANVSFEIFTIVEKQAAERDIEIVEDCSMQHPRLIGSPIHFKRLVMNIMSNAIKYNIPHGKVYINCHEASFDGKNIMLEISIRDTGIGMSEEFQKHLFEPFQQENFSARSKYEGTGLGMSIAKSLADKLGGTITCESKKGVGSTFTIRVPFEVDFSENDSVAQDGEENISIAGETIILAEDNDINLEIAQFIISEAGAKVIVAHNGKEAVNAYEASEEGEVSAILMDIMMPVMDGYEATRHIRAMGRSDAKRIPIVAMTANAFAEDRIATKKAGMNEHISKPLDAKKVIRVIAEQVKAAKEEK